MTLLLGDCLEVMPTLAAGSVDAVVTDPPYGIRFMGKAWDGVAIEEATRRRNARNVGRTFTASDGSVRRKDTQPYAPISSEAGAYDFSVKGNRAFQEWCEAWATEAFRVAKPGAYLLAFGGTRTYHRLTCAIEDAGWIIRDCLVWAYASGFPKSRALLKPAWEPIVLARKPGPLRELAIDACRIPGVPPSVPQPAFGSPTGAIYGMKAGEGRNGEMSEAAGRWPSNVLLTADEDGRGIFDGDTPGVVGGGDTGAMPGTYRRAPGTVHSPPQPMSWASEDTRMIVPGYGDSGTYSRFFLIPKSARSEREPVLNNLYCNCETDKPRQWASADLSPVAPTASTSPGRATSEATSTGDSGSDTLWNGSAISDPSHLDSRSTTSTATRRTTSSPTSSLSIPSPTSGSIPAARSSAASGGSNAPSAASSDPSIPSGGISPLRAGLSTAAAVPATSPKSLKRSVCERCGREVAKSGERVNAHPT